MNRVFVPHMPSRFDSASALWVPTIDISPARKFGEIISILPPESNRLHIAPLVAALKDRMADFCADDYLVAVGDPTILAAAASIASRQTGGILRMLKWDRRASDYIEVRVMI